jgi:luciferase family oxidoreductase group 1
MKPTRSVPFSVLDLSFVREGETPGDALRSSLELARHVEKLGFHRFWMAEHHNMEGIASAATAVALGFVANGTHRIRVGSGGIMLPNHSPLVIAEQFGTLESLYPGRIDLGLGRAPGTDPRTARALRREMKVDSADTFPNDVQELASYFEAAVPGQAVRAVPGEGLEIPIWLLGSSLFSAKLAAFLGLPFAFASHFAPEHLMAALEIYRKEFEPSKALQKPYAMVAANVIVAESDTKAQFEFSSSQIGVLNILLGKRTKLQPPVAGISATWSEAELAGIERFLHYSFVGSPSTVKRGIVDFLEETGADELITTTRIFDPVARLRSFELLADIREEIEATLERELASV